MSCCSRANDRLLIALPSEKTIGLTGIKALPVCLCRSVTGKKAIGVHLLVFWFCGLIFLVLLIEEAIHFGHRWLLELFELLKLAKLLRS